VQISSRSDLKRRYNKTSSDMRSVPDQKLFKLHVSLEVLTQGKKSNDQ